MNALLADKVSIVSPIAQTTRNRIRGILTEPRGQLVFLDTPGVFKAQHDLGRMMNKAARASIEGVDGVILVLDPSRALRDEDIGWMRKLAKAGTHVDIVLNKKDLAWTVDQAQIQEVWEASCPSAEHEVKPRWHQISALENDGVAALVDQLFMQAPVGPPLFPEDMLSDFPRQLAVADVIREKYFEVLRDEVPHDVAVRVNSLHEQGADWTIEADVLVNRSSQKGIVIGEKGRLIRRVKRASVREIEDMYDVHVTLYLWVKVEKNWSRNFWILRQLGYD
jgi:GTP-binding protein Era